MVGDFMLDTADKLELVDKFCYLGNILGVQSYLGDILRCGAEEASRTRAKCAWDKLIVELVQIVRLVEYHSLWQ